MARKGSSDEVSSDSDGGGGGGGRGGGGAGKEKEKAKSKPKGEAKKEEEPVPEEKKPVFTKIEAKKMNPAKMKEVLKAYGASMVGNKKDLLDRLLKLASDA